MESEVERGYNYAYIWVNGQQLWETEHRTYSSSGVVRSIGGRVVNLEASAGNDIALRAAKTNGIFNRINYCVEYIPKIKN